MNISQIFSAESQNVYEFLTIDGQGCFIPSYQRGYAWDSGHVGRLLEDATLGLEHLVQDSSSVRFLGSIITVEGNELVAAPPPFDRELPRRVVTIIDGQQRLCTVVILNIIFHRKLSSLIEALADADDPGVVALREDAADFLDDLAKTFRFERARGREINRLYPRIVRAYEDTWSRNDQTADYSSPIAKAIWSYVEYLQPTEDDEEEEEERDGFHYDGTDENGGLIDGHEALVDAWNYLSEQIDQLAAADHPTLSLPTVEQIVADGSIVLTELWPHALPRQTRAFLNDNEDEQYFEESAQTVRLLALARYVNFRMAATVIDASNEDYAFDMFESLNTTGQPLTAFETFKPKVVEFETSANYPSSPSKVSVDKIQKFLDRFKNAEQRLQATSSLLIPFALAENGHRLEKHLSHQRRYLREQYTLASTRPAKRAFVQHLATTADFVGSAWRPRTRHAPQLLPDRVQTDPIAEFCFEALRTIRHDIVLAPLSRFYAAYCNAAAAGRDEAAVEFFGAVKAVTAFSMLWRAAKGGTANIDSVYRELMSRGIGGGAALGRRAGGAVSLANLKAALQSKLDEEGLDRATWVADTSVAAIYKTGQAITRFLLLAAAHDAVPDEDAPGMIIKGRRGTNTLLTRAQWGDDETLTVEHVAPDAQHSQGWPGDVYNERRTVQRLGNFVLIPEVENNLLANRPWEQKRILYRMFGADTRAKATRALTDGRAVGFNPGRRAEQLVEESTVLPMCQAISAFAGPWDEAFIAARSIRLAELAWDTLHPWLEPSRAAVRRTRRAG